MLSGGIFEILTGWALKVCRHCRNYPCVCGRCFWRFRHSHENRGFTLDVFRCSSNFHELYERRRVTNIYLSIVTVTQIWILSRITRIKLLISIYSYYLHFLHLFLLGLDPSDISPYSTKYHSTCNLKRQRGEKKPIPDAQKDDKYFERRRRNNQAAKKSRDARKIREDQVNR